MTRKEHAERITENYSKGVASVIATGKAIRAAKDALKHGQFLDMVKIDLPFGINQAQKLVVISRDIRITNTYNTKHLPPHWSTLYELTKLEDHEFDAGIESGEINPGMIGSAVKELMGKPPHGEETGDTAIESPIDAAYADVVAAWSMLTVKYGKLAAVIAATIKDHGSSGALRVLEEQTQGAHLELIATSDPRNLKPLIEKIKKGSNETETNHA